MTPLNVHWFDGRSTRARPAQALLQASPQGPVLWLRPEGGAPFAVPRKDVQWPERWSARRTPETLSIDLGPHGSLQVHDPAAWQAALAAAREETATRACRDRSRRRRQKADEDWARRRQRAKRRHRGR